MLDNIISNAIGSIVGGLVVALAFKLGLSAWKKIAVSFSWVIGIALVAAFIIFGAIKLVQGIEHLHEKQSLQVRIDKFLKGNYPKEFQEGYGIEVVEISPRVFLGYKRPSGNEPINAPHPLGSAIITTEVIAIVNNEGFPGKPIFGYLGQPTTFEELAKVIKN